MADEYIRKQDALDAFGLSEKTRKYGGDHSGYDTRMLYEIHDALTGIPAADVAPVKHAYWIDTDNYYRRWRCSACSGHTKEAHPLFCPFCGAKMDGEE